MTTTDMQAKFHNVSCSQCGRDFGPGNSGFSDCRRHAFRDWLYREGCLLDEPTKDQCIDAQRRAFEAALASRPRENAAAPQAEAVLKEDLASVTRMLNDACADMGFISEALGIDPEEAGGAVPILDAIEELKTKAGIGAEAAQGVASADAIIAEFRASGMNLEPSPNALYTVRGQHAQLIEGVRSLSAAAPSPDRERVGEGSHELGYAQRLVTSVWEKHYMDDAPDWKPLPDLMGVLTQIDNMLAGMVPQKDASPSRECGKRQGAAPTYNEIAALLLDYAKACYESTSATRMNEARSAIMLAFKRALAVSAPTLGDGNIAEEAARIADSFTCGTCGMDGKAGARIRQILGDPMGSVTVQHGLAPQPQAAEPKGLTDEQREAIRVAADTAHRVLCAGGDYGDELSDAGLRRDLKAARDQLRVLLGAKGE